MINEIEFEIGTSNKKKRKELENVINEIEFEIGTSNRSSNSNAK